MSNAPFSIGEALRFGWNTLKQNVWFFVLILIIAGLVTQIPSMLGGKEGTATGLFSLIAWVLQMLINLGLNKIALMLHDGTKPTWKELFMQYPLLLKYLGAAIIYGVAVAIGLVLLVVPGIYLGIKYAFFGFVMVDKKTSIMDSFKTSAKLTEGVKWELLGFGIVMCVLNILGAIAILIGLFVTIPITLMASVYVYRKLEGRMHQATIVTATTVTPPAPPVAPA